MGKIAEYEIKATKRLGQNFLVDTNVADKEVRQSKVSKKDVVLEIGSGYGVLTKRLADVAKKVYAVEKDPKMVNVLNREVGDLDNVEIIAGDFLKIDLPEFDLCVANIPYNISSSIVERLGRLGKGGVLIVQREFAQRLTADPGSRDYSRLTVLSRFYFDVSILSNVNPRCFRPIPKVFSSMIRLVPVKREIEDKEGFFRFVRAIFNHKRKTLASALKCCSRDLDLPKEKLMEISGKIKYSDARVNKLELDKLFELHEDFRKLL